MKHIYTTQIKISTCIIQLVMFFGLISGLHSQVCIEPDPNALCTPPTNWNKNVVANGTVTWNSLGLGSADNVIQKIRISGTGTVKVQMSNLIFKSSSAVLFMDGPTLIVENGNLQLDVSGSRYIQHKGALRTYGNFQQTTNTVVCIIGASVEIGEEDAGTNFTNQTSTSASWQNNGGYRFLEYDCINVTHDFQLQSTGSGTGTNGVDVILNSCIEIGDRGITHATSADFGISDGNDSGNWQNSNRQYIFNTDIIIANGSFQTSINKITACNMDVKVNKSGSFQVNSGKLEGEHVCVAVEDKFENSGTWTASVEHWYSKKQNSTNVPGAGTESSKTEILSKCFGPCSCVSCIVNSITAIPGSCVSNSNTYSLTGVINSSQAPNSGTLTVQITGGGSQLFNAPFSSTTNYSISAQIADESVHTVSATFSSDASCTKSVTYQSPPGCAVCPANACLSENVVKNGDMETGTPPSNWTVANGTPASEWTLGTGSSTGDFGVLNNDDDNTDRYIEQFIYSGITENTIYILKALGATHNVSNSSSIAEIYMEFYNGNTLLATSAKSKTTHGYNGSLQAMTDIQMAAPANTTRIRIVGHTKGRAFKVDNVVLLACNSCVPPIIEHTKEWVGLTIKGQNKYQLEYKITVKNKGGAAGQYNLSDAPNFENDVNITGANYKCNAVGNPGNPGPLALAGTGPWTLATNQNINAGATQTFNIYIDVTIDLGDASGDNKYDECGKSLKNIPIVGEGLFNESRLDIDRDGKTDQRDTACSDLPFLVHSKYLIGVTTQNINTYIVEYQIDVENKGAASTQYNLSDAPGFENDIAIISANYISNAMGNPANPGSIVLAGNGPWTLATNQTISGRVTQTYNIKVTVTINLGDKLGDNRYDECGYSLQSKPKTGEGLFNESRLDIDRDGQTDTRDTACADLPFIVHSKNLVGVTTTGYNTYQVEYKILVENKGGAATQYNLSDAPNFDNDIAIMSAKYQSNATDNLGNPGPFHFAGTGPWILATNQKINSGEFQSYTLLVNVSMNLEDAQGDNRYNECGKSQSVPISGEGLFNESRLDVNRDGVTDAKDTACADLPYILHSKSVVGVTSLGINAFRVVYQIKVDNIGGASTQYFLYDVPRFDNDIIITAANYTSTAVGNPGNPNPVSLLNTGTWILATDQTIGVRSTQTYLINVDVRIDLNDASGDNRYDECGKSIELPISGEGLFNESRLDANRDGQIDARDTACADIPYLVHSKNLVGVTSTGLNTYMVEYRITVENKGGISTQYNLIDAPAFDNDISITSANYLSNATGNLANPGPVTLLNGGPWTLSTNQNIIAGASQTYNIRIHVLINLQDASGDNRYDHCGKSLNKPKTGEGLFNESRLDVNRDGQPDARDTACADLPFIIHDKTLVGVTPVGGLNNYLVEYRITVENKGGLPTQYNLSDAPDFENDIIITAANYSSNASGNPGNPVAVVLIGNGPWTLATNQDIAAGAIQTYTIRIYVSINLEDATGDNRYDECGNISNRPRAGEGLFNESRLDINKDGIPDARDTACADLPFLKHTKSFVGMTNTGLNSFKVEYQIKVENIGGTTSQYNLSDVPSFDNDIIITGTNYTSNAIGNPGNPGPVNLVGSGPWIVATNQSIGSGIVQLYKIVVDVKLNLSDALGDNKYDECGLRFGNKPISGEGLFNESRLDINRDGTPDARDTACADLPYIHHSKKIVGVANTGLNTYLVEYRIVVENKGGTPVQYNLSDAPGFDNDINITSANYFSNAIGNAGNPGPLNLVGAGPWTLAVNQTINAGTTQIYNIRIHVVINLDDAQGDNRYDECGRKNQSGLMAGEGLFNESRLDIDRDGITDARDTACADLPFLIHNKTIVGVSNTGSNTFRIEYKISVENKGGTNTQYNLSDAPNFDNDIIITAANFSSDVSGNTNSNQLSGTGPWTLASNKNIGAGDIHNYFIRVDIQINLEDAIGDNRYDKCGSLLQRPSAGEGLFNESRLDINRDGQPDARDTACTDLPYIIHQKNVIGVIQTGARTFEVTYRITVQNLGSAIALYGLKDRPDFDNDINILNANFTSNVPGSTSNPGPLPLIGSGIWTLASNQSIGNGITHSYIIKVQVSINLEDALTGNNKYDECGKNNSGRPRSGEGLFNESLLDINYDGTTDQADTACTDIPYIVHNKSVIGVTNLDNNNYKIVYGIEVKNLGGSSGTYNLMDLPGFDDDVEILNASYATAANGNPGNPGPASLIGSGPWMLANDQTIGRFETQFYTLTILVNIDLTNPQSVGDEILTPCETSIPGVPKSGEGLFNQTTLDVNDDGIPDQRDSVCTSIELGGLGDTVWNDLDGDGVQDPGEPGVIDVVAILYDCASLQILRRDTTDSDGFYFFDNLIPSKDYYIKFDLILQPLGYGFTLQDSGANDSKDSDVNASGIGACTRIEAGERDSTYDAGIILLAALGDFVWHDRNADGKQTAGEEGIQSVTVNLYEAFTNSFVKSTSTTASGFYLFKNLVPKDYYVKFEPPAGMSFTIANKASDFQDSDVDNSNGPGTSTSTNLSPGETDRTWDAGLVKCVKISGDVFADLNYNGIFDSDEKGINGLKVYLVDATNQEIVATAITYVRYGTTSDDGYYEFKCIKPGTYYLRFEKPGDLAASQAYKGNNPNKDSDITHENGLNTTKKFTLQSGDALTFISAGFQRAISLGSKVWLDGNNNGIQDLDESPVSGITISAYSNKGIMISQSVSETDGHFVLNGIAPGDIYVKFDIPNNSYKFTKSDAGLDDRDSDVDGSFGFGTTKLYTVNVGEESPNIDAGIIPIISDMEWLSVDGNFNGDFTALDWSTKLDFDNDYFIIERKHETDKEFNEIANVQANDLLVFDRHIYEYEDFNVDKVGHYYYRLKQVNKLGAFSYSKTISVNINSNNALSVYIYPNPVKEILKIELWIIKDSELEVKVFDLNGKVVHTAPFNEFKLKGKYDELLDISNLASGQYLLQIKTSTDLINKIFIVSR